MTERAYYPPVAPADVVDWAALAEPFPATEVKQRPGAAKWEHKPSCEGSKCREAKDPAKHHQFSYVDARAVAQRLDDVVTPSQWEFTCAVIPGSDIVKGRLVIAGVVREDHGYPNSDRDEEPIKAATSDALKRCAVLFGVGRHLYEDNTPNAAPPPRRPATAAAPTPPRPVAVANPYDDPYPEHLSDLDAPPPDAGRCPVHNAPWRTVPAGVSKTTGKPYDEFQACPERGCREKPGR